MCGINLRGKIVVVLAMSALFMVAWYMLPAFINGISVRGIKPVVGILITEHCIDIPFHYQVKTYYCGPAALKMIFNFYGENVSQFEIVDVGRTVPYVTYTDELRRATHPFLSFV